MRITKQASCPAPSVRRDAGGSATGNESFVTVNDDSATLPNSRQITAGDGIGIADGGAGNPITISGNDTVRVPIWIPGRLFSGAQSPTFSPAPREDIIIADNVFNSVKYIVDVDTYAQAQVSIPKFLDSSYFLWTLYWVTDSEDTDDVAFDVDAIPLGNGEALTGGWTGYTRLLDANTGANNVNIVSGALSTPTPPVSDDFLKITVRRAGSDVADTLDDSAWFLGICLTIGLELDS